MTDHVIVTALHKAPPAHHGRFFEPVVAFAALKAWVIPTLVQRATVHNPARVWIAGCATGEEAYTVAMLMMERCEVGAVQPHFRIFATDIDSDSIDHARAGVYSDEEIAKVSAERRQKFFDRRASGQSRVRGMLREHVVFATHDLTVDPPLPHLDLIVCRNVLAGLAPEARQKALALLRFALNDGGHLLLGGDDSLGSNTEIFEPLSIEASLYRRMGEGRHRLPNRLPATLAEARTLRLAPPALAREVSGTRLPTGQNADRSAREDLEIAREELGALNEELSAINAQLTANIEELDSTYGDMMQLLSATNISVMFLDSDLRVTRFTSPAAALLGLREEDAGRLCGAVLKGIDDEIALDARVVLARGAVAEKNVRTRHGRCYLRRVQPHRVAADRVGGVVITYVDITNQLTADAQLRRFAAVLRDSEDAILVLDFAGWIKAWNRGAERLYGYTEAEALKLNMRDLATRDSADHTQEVMRRVASGEVLPSFDTQRRTRGGRMLDVSATVALLLDDAGNPESLATTERDITARRRMEEATRKALQKEIIDVATLEQRRIGQELHDGTQQELTGLGLLSLSLSETLIRNGATTAGQLAARVAQGIEQANQRVRSLARGMVPVPIDREGLMSALAELARQTTEIHGLPCGFECPAPVEIDNDNEATHLYRIAQEAVSNATRHAQASALWIRLEQVDGRLVLEVRDNGTGLRASGTSGKGVGLHLMEHRCAMIGGTFAIEPRPQGGTSIACSVRRVEEA